MTTLTNRPHTALVVIDVQNDVVGCAYERDAVVSRIGALVEQARGAGTPVLWVQHNDEGLPKDSDGWNYVAELVRSESEPLVHKQYGDSFEATTLESELAAASVGHLVVVGAESDACIRYDPRSLHPRL